MIILISLTVALFTFFNSSPILHGPVGLSFQISISIIGAIGLLQWIYESQQKTSASNSDQANSFLKDQLTQFHNIPTMIKLAIFVFSIVLPVAISKLI
jgi:hypothetical protein